MLDKVLSSNLIVGKDNRSLRCIFLDFLCGQRLHRLASGNQRIPRNIRRSDNERLPLLHMLYCPKRWHLTGNILVLRI